MTRHPSPTTDPRPPVDVPLWVACVLAAAAGFGVTTWMLRRRGL